MHGRFCGDSEGALGAHAVCCQGHSWNDRLRPPVDSLTQLRHHYDNYISQAATYTLSRTFRSHILSLPNLQACPWQPRGPVCSPCTRARLQPMHPMHGCVGVSFGSREKGPTRCFRGRKHMNQDGAMPNRKACHRSPGIQTVLEACDKGQPPPSGTIEPTRVWFKPRPRPVCIVPLFHCRRRHLESPLPARRSMHIREPTWSIMQARSRQHQRMPVRCLWGSWHAW